MIWDRHAVRVRRRHVTIKDVPGYEIPDSTSFRRISTICEARAKLKGVTGGQARATACVIAPSAHLKA